MIKPTEREILKSSIEKESNFLQGVIRPIGDYYHGFIRGYGKEDRGLEEALKLIDYLKSDVWLIFVENRAQVSVFFPMSKKSSKLLTN